MATTLEAPQSQQPEDPGHKEHNGWWSKGKKAIVGTIAASATVAAGIGAGYTLRSDNKASEARDIPSTSASITPGEAQKTPEVKFGISAAEFNNNPTALAEECIRQINQLYISGVNKSSAESPQRSDFPDDKSYVETTISPQYDEAFINSLLAEGWEDNPRFYKWATNITTIADTTRTVRMATMSGGTQKPYVRALSINGAVTSEIKGDVIVTSIPWRGWDNRNENNADEDIYKNGAPDINGETGTDVITWQVDPSTGLRKITDAYSQN